MPGYKLKPEHRKSYKAQTSLAKKATSKSLGGGRTAPKMVIGSTKSAPPGVKEQIIKLNPRTTRAKTQYQGVEVGSRIKTKRPPTIKYGPRTHPTRRAGEGR
jgi:hypothetical protein